LVEAPLDEVELLRRFFGLNQYEARVYIALLKRPMSLSEVSSAAKIPKPRVYDVVRSLESKGFVRSSGAELHAINPEVALPARRASLRAAFEEEDSKRLRAQMALVDSLKSSGEHTPREPVILRGFEQVVALLYQVLPQSNQVMLTLNKALEARAYFRGAVKGAVGTGRQRVIMALMPLGVKLEREDLELIDTLGAQVRLTAGVLLDTMVTDTDDVVIGLPDPSSTQSVPVVAVYVKDHAFASSLRDTFKKVWSTASAIS